MKYKNIKIPSDIKLKVYKISDENSVIILEDTKKNIVWFTTKRIRDGEMEINSNRELKASQYIVNKLKKGIKNLKFGYLRTLTLNGVGFKASIEGDLLSLKIGKPEAAEYKIPSDISLKIEKNNVIAWSLSISKISNFFAKILKETPVKKGGILIYK